jgi:hypothetical protein
MTYIDIMHIVFGQTPPSVVSVTKDGSMGLLIKLLIIITLFSKLASYSTQP